MIVSQGFRFVFVSTPRCCTETMYTVLQDRYGGVRVSTLAHDNYIPQQYREWFTFSIIRNPFDRAVSLWAWFRRYPRVMAALGADKSFDAFAAWLAGEGTVIRPGQSYAAMPQAQYLWLAPVCWNTLLRFELLEAELQRLSFWKRGTPLPHKHKTDHKPYRDYYGRAETVDAVRRWAGRDFDLYGYEPNP